MGRVMPKDPNSGTSAVSDAGSIPTDAEIEAAAERLDPSWLKGPTRPAAGQSNSHRVVQSLPLGRAHSVAVEVKRPPKRRA